VWTANFPGGGGFNTAPAVDPNRKFVYANGNDGVVHKLNVGSGTEVKTGGWPELAGTGKSASQLTIGTASCTWSTATRVASAAAPAVT
jgi:hypothetical protein